MISADYPVCHRLKGRNILLVGGGEIATARARELLAAGAQIRVVASRASAALKELTSRREITLEERPFEPADVAGAHIVFTAINDLEVSHLVAAEARRLNIPINAADIPELCDFTLPSVGRRGPITIAVSTGGAAPALAARLQRELTRSVGTRHIQLVRLVAWLRARIPGGPIRMKLLKEVVHGDVGNSLLDGQRARAFANVRTQLQNLDAPQ